ncbi:unnamed protein product [Meganyctiphanes norvegica]|uniref:Uncharacterized protein n=1 Tax=Meganyctiphanes norvegica TaxID=48144 RepID=A0AAV2RHS9_MEGNR
MKILRLITILFFIQDFTGTFSVSVGTPTLTVTPHANSVDVIFLRLYPWDSVTDFNLTIHRGTDNRGDVLCSSSPFTCNVLACKINGDEYCDTLPSCTDVFVEVSTNVDVSSALSKTLCDTTVLPQTTKPITTIDVTTSTIDVTTTTISPGAVSGLGLACFSCLGCPDVDSNTNVETNDAYQSCFTAIYGTSEIVVRGGDAELHDDGDCQIVDGHFTCYCNSDLCNHLNAF